MDGEADSPTHVLIHNLKLTCIIPCLKCKRIIPPKSEKRKNLTAIYIIVN